MRRRRRAIGRPAASEPGVGRDALIDKTCDLLRELPPNRVTRAEVARHTNVDPSLIRYYFRDRSSLLVAAAERLSSRFTRILDDENRSAEPTAIGQLRARVSAVLKFQMTYPFFHRLLLEEVMTSRTPTARRLLNGIARDATNAYGEILETGVEDGKLRKSDPAFLFLAIIGMCEFFVSGMPMLKIALNGKLDSRAASGRYSEFVCDLLLHGLAASGRAASGRNARRSNAHR